MSRQEIADIIRAANVQLVSKGYVREKLLGPNYSPEQGLVYVSDLRKKFVVDAKYQNFRKQMLSYL
jgi:hypothetical protein